MFHWEPEGRYRHRHCTAIAPFWFSTEHLWIVIATFLLSTDSKFMVLCRSVISKTMISHSSNVKFWSLYKFNWCTVRAPVFGTLNSAISNYQTWFVRTVMEVLKCCWMYETSNMQCNYNSFIQIINFHGLFRNALRCRKNGACRILVPLW